MLSKLILLRVIAAVISAKSCIECICDVESGCRALGCRQDAGSLSCGYYQIKLPYYEDCGEPGKKPGESVETAWKRCADNKACATTCVNNYYNRYKGNCPSSMGTCEKMARLHNGGPSGCKISATVGYWNKVKSCCGCT